MPSGQQKTPNGFWQIRFSSQQAPLKQNVPGGQQKAAPLAEWQNRFSSQQAPLKQNVPGGQHTASPSGLMHGGRPSPQAHRPWMHFVPLGQQIF